MFAMGTSMLRMATAKAAIADGIVMSARFADMVPGAALHAQDRLEWAQLRYRSCASGMGSGGAAVT